MRWSVLALVLAVVAGCATTPPTVPPAVSAPDLRGAWTGSWGGGPLTLFVTEQRNGHGDSGLVIGPWQVLGQQFPTVAGVLTATIRGEAVSTHVDGLVGNSGGQLIVSLRARAAAGDQRLTLRLVATDRLEGTGDSQYAWGPQGPVQLVRQAQPRATLAGAGGWTSRS